MNSFVESDDAYVDFSCGSNEFGPLLQNLFGIKFLAFDLFPPKNTLGFKRKDWFKVTNKDLEGLRNGPDSNNLIIGLNPPFGFNNVDAERFVLHAIQFKPRLLVLICPDLKGLCEKNGYTLEFEDPDIVNTKTFYVPGFPDRKFRTTTGPRLFVYKRIDAADKSGAVESGRASRQGVEMIDVDAHNDSSRSIGSHDLNPPSMDSQDASDSLMPDDQNQLRFEDDAQSSSTKIQFQDVGRKRKSSLMDSSVSERDGSSYQTSRSRGDSPRDSVFNDRKGFTTDEAGRSDNKWGIKGDLNQDRREGSMSGQYRRSDRSPDPERTRDMRDDRKDGGSHGSRESVRGASTKGKDSDRRDRVREPERRSHEDFSVRSSLSETGRSSLTPRSRDGGDVGFRGRDTDLERRRGVDRDPLRRSDEGRSFGRDEDFGRGSSSRSETLYSRPASYPRGESPPRNRLSTTTFRGDTGWGHSKDSDEQSAFNRRDADPARGRQIDDDRHTIPSVERDRQGRFNDPRRREGSPCSQSSDFGRRHSSSLYTSDRDWESVSYKSRIPSSHDRRSEDNRWGPGPRADDPHIGTDSRRLTSFSTERVSVGNTQKGSDFYSKHASLCTTGGRHSPAQISDRDRSDWPRVGNRRWN